MQPNAPIPFDPEHSVQDNLEKQTFTKLEERFPEFLDTLIRCCAQVQEFAFDLIQEAISTELQLRFKDEFTVKGKDEFELRGVRYRRVLNFVDALGEGAIACRFRKKNEPEELQKFSQKTKRWEMSLTANSVQAYAEVSLKDFLPVVTDIVHRVIRAANGWLEGRLAEMNKRSQSNALSAIRSVLKAEFGKLANEMMIYPYANTGQAFMGTYLMDQDVYGTVVERIKRCTDSSVPRSQQIAGMIETTLNIEETDSRGAIATRKSIVLNPTVKGRPYEFNHSQIFHGEQAYYGPDELISHPLVFASEITDTHLVMAYPIRFREMTVNGETIPQRVEGLRPQIRGILKNNDLVAPILWFTRRFRNADNSTAVSVTLAARAKENAIEEIKTELFQLLKRFVGWPPPDGNRASITARVTALSLQIRQCAMVEQLQKAKVIALAGPSFNTLEMLEKTMHESNQNSSGNLAPNP